MRMTEEALLASIESLATELVKLSHEIDLPPDEDARTHEDALDVALIVRSIDRLCIHNRGGLARLVHFMTELQQHHDDDSREVH
jgi:hypothetical protein